MATKKHKPKRSESVDRANYATTRKPTASLLKDRSPLFAAATHNKTQMEEITLGATASHFPSSLPSQSSVSYDLNGDEKKHEDVLSDFLDDVVPEVAHEIDRIASLSRSQKEAMDIHVTDLRIKTSTMTPSDDNGMIDLHSTQPSLSPVGSTFLDTQTRSFNLTLRKNLSGLSKSRGRSTLGHKRFTQMFTLRQLTLKARSMVTERSLSERSDYEIDEEEKKEMELCQSIGLEQFVTVSCFCIQEILKLNHQSLNRFRKTKYFSAFNENVNLKQLLEELHSDMD